MKSRRAALQSFVLGSLGIAAVPAAISAKKKKKKPCPPCKGRKKGKCKRTLPNGTACPGGTCQDEICVATTEPPQTTSAPECIAHEECRGPGRDYMACYRGRCCAIGGFRCGYEECCRTVCCSGYCVDNSGFGGGRSVCPGNF